MTASVTWSGLSLRHTYSINHRVSYLLWSCRRTMSRELHGLSGDDRRCYAKAVLHGSWTTRLYTPKFACTHGRPSGKPIRRPCVVHVLGEAPAVSARCTFACDNLKTIVSADVEPTSASERLQKRLAPTAHMNTQAIGSSSAIAQCPRTLRRLYMKRLELQKSKVRFAECTIPRCSPVNGASSCAICRF